MMLESGCSRILRTPRAQPTIISAMTRASISLPTRTFRRLRQLPKTFVSERPVVDLQSQIHVLQTMPHQFTPPGTVLKNEAEREGEALRRHDVLHP